MIEVHYKMNTPGVEDGLFEGWLYNSDYPDGVRGAYHDDVQYRDADHPDLAINQLLQAHYYGGPVRPRRPSSTCTSTTSSSRRRRIGPRVR